MAEFRQNSIFEKTTAGHLAARWRERSVKSVFINLFLAVLLCSSGIVQAQSYDDEIAPPPLKLLTREELTQLNAETEVKKRTKLALELMEARIVSSENLHSRQEFDEMFKQLGSFHGLMDNTLGFLNKRDKDSGKVLNNFKRLEMGLRKFRPRLELIRRELPSKYDQYVRNLIRNLRDARTIAMEPLFDDTVLPGRKP